MVTVNKVAIFGYSGHAYVLLDSMINLGYEPVFYLDQVEKVHNPYNLQYLGSENQTENIKQILDLLVFPAVGDNLIRKKIVELSISNKLMTFNIVDRTASVSKNLVFNNSSYIGKNCCINALCKIGVGVIINTGAIVEHECFIDDYSHIAPNSTLCGNVRIGKNVFFGAGAVAKQGIKIDDNAVIGAGSVVLHDIPKNEIWAGNPARFIRKIL